MSPHVRNAPVRESRDRVTPVMHRLLLPLLALVCLGACVDKGTEPGPPSGLLATNEATWGMTHATISAAPNDSCDSPDHWVDEETFLRSAIFMEGTWRGRTFTGSWSHHLLSWDDILVSGTLVATVSPDDSLVTSFTVDQHIVWNLGPDHHRHETAQVEYIGPGLALSDDIYGYIYRVFGDVCCEDLTVRWTTWREEDPDCVYTTEDFSCIDVSSLHLGFYPRP